MGVVVNFDYRRVWGAARVVLSTGNPDYYEDGSGGDYENVDCTLVVVMMIAWRECEWNSANLLQEDGDDFRERFAPATLIEAPRSSLVPRTTGSACRWE